MPKDLAITSSHNFAFRVALALMIKLQVHNPQLVQEFAWPVTKVTPRDVGFCRTVTFVGDRWLVEVDVDIADDDPNHYLNRLLTTATLGARVHGPDQPDQFWYGTARNTAILPELEVETSLLGHALILDREIREIMRELESDDFGGPDFTRLVREEAEVKLGQLAQIDPDWAHDLGIKLKLQPVRSILTRNRKPGHCVCGHPSVGKNDRNEEVCADWPGCSSN